MGVAISGPHQINLVRAALHTAQNSLPLKSVSGKELEKCMTQVASGQWPRP